MGFEATQDGLPNEKGKEIGFGLGEQWECGVTNHLPRISQGFASILFGKAVILRCCILENDSVSMDALMPDVIGGEEMECDEAGGRDWPG